MKTHILTTTFCRTCLLLLFLITPLALPGPPGANAAMNDYCIKPPFIAEIITPNLLLMLDNSASMYDLAYPDKGRKTCSATTTRYCTSDAGCPAGETCSVFTRQPYYCYDQSYASTNTYIGYFQRFDSSGRTTYYSYNFTNAQFEPTTSWSCSGTGTTYQIANQLCVIINDTTNTITEFKGSGNYLNWLTASKFDVEKQILTGGKYVGTQLIAESRGCVGEMFIKEANTADFVNYDRPETNNRNTSLGITFAVRGPFDPYNDSGPSPGGQTYIEVYKGNYIQSSCQDAIDAITSGGNADIKQTVDNCLAYQAGGTQSAVVKTKVSFQQSMQACWQFRGGRDIGGDDINTVKNQCTDIYPGFATCSNDPRKICTSDTNCGTGNTCQYGPEAIVPGNPALLCGNAYEGQYYFYQGAGTAGKCSATGLACTSNTDCPAIKKCSKTNNICSSNTDCTGSGNTCKSVTNVCNTTATAAGWFLRPDATEAAMIETHRQFCRDLATPPVIDPTDAPSNSSQYDNVPPIISSTGIISQLDIPKGTLKVAVQNTTTPTGLLQKFDGRIRMGAMSFNFVGSATESGVSVPVTKVCSVTTSKTCTSYLDCPLGETCVNATSGTTNKDGAQVISLVGKGHCSVTTATECATKAHCPSGEVCISDGVGDHSAGLVNAIDSLVAKSWTPFAEGFYNAIGYFAQSTSDARYSRTAMRLNSSDFPDAMNPSEMRCQGNNLLLVTDGMSTADRNSTVSNLATLYSSAFTAATSSSTGWSDTCPIFGGSFNIDSLAWLAQNRKITTMSLSTASAAPTVTLNNNEKITTWVVFNGADNGQSGDCNTVTLMKKTAVNGGSPGAYIVEDPLAFQNALTDAFEKISAGSASGTAASILSNSEGTSAVILQALFYPKKYFDGNTSATWIGELHDFWYYVDPFIGNSTIREDTDYGGSGAHTLNLINDYVANFYFDAQANQTMVRLAQDIDGNGSGDNTMSTVSTDNVKSIWKAGKQLWSRNLSSDARTIYTQIGASSDVPVAGGNLKAFTTDANSDLAKYLDVVAGTTATSAELTTAQNVITYIRGSDVTGLRSRTVTIGGTSGVWRLGDIVSSTPRIQSTLPTNNYSLGAPSGYGDSSYDSFVNSSQYLSRGMAYVGANDGMLHAFKLGTLTVSSTGAQKGTLSGSNLGREEWAFIPKNALPYLKHLADPTYSHLYYVDATPTVLDASIGNICNATNYWVCDKLSVVVDGNNSLDSAKNPWRSIIIGGMGLGGATRALGSTCTNCVKTPRTDPADSSKQLGYSSYFALDVTDPANPKFLWEFNDPALGFATTGPAIIRVGDRNKNGRWFAVFASGPTGSIDTTKHQMLGKSDQTLKLFVVDLATGTLIRTIDTNISNAFAGSLQGGAIDTDRWNSASTGFYQDDAVYLGYVIQNGTAWNAGGVLRLLTKENTDPGTWTVGSLISGIGPVTVGISRLQDRKNKNLWLYWGTGRFYFKSDATSDLDDCGNQRAIYAVKDPCYTTVNDLNQTCTTSAQLSAITDQTTSTVDALDTGRTGGWRIVLDNNTSNSCSSGVCTASGTSCDSSSDCPNFCAERIVTNPVALGTGVLFYTSFAPTADICSYGGNSYLWALKYDTGYKAPAAASFGKAIIQMSTGTFEEKAFIDQTTSIFTAKEGRRTETPMVGKPPADPPMILSRSQNKPVKKFIHIQEK